MEKSKNPFPFSDNNRRFHTWDYYLKHRFGGKVFKLSLDGGFSCPNLDGTRGTGGCSYCQYSISSHKPEDLLTQMERQKAMLEKKWPSAVGYIPYFQANTNTYAPLSVLRKKYETALSFEKVVGLSIATRADAIADEVYDYLEEIAHRTYLTVELGLQTIHDETARRINRGHSFEEFRKAVMELDKRGIPVCVHIINGLPFETKEMMVETAKVLSSLPIHSLKIHLLHVVEGTRLAEEWKRGDWETLSLEEYVDIVCDQIELLPPLVTIQRVTGDGERESLLAPLWSLKKFVVMNEIDKELVRRDSYQGKRYSPPPKKERR